MVTHAGALSLRGHRGGMGLLAAVSDTVDTHSISSRPPRALGLARALDALISHALSWTWGALDGLC